MEVGEQGRGPVVGGGLGGDARRTVSRQNRPVQRRPTGRCRLLPQQDGDQGVQEQGAAGQHVRAIVAGGQVQGVEFDAGGAKCHHGAADGVGQWPVFVFGVDDGDLHPGVEGPQDVEFDEVGLPGTGAGQHDAVVVFLRPPVPPDHATGGGVDAVQHPAGGFGFAG